MKKRDKQILALRIAYVAGLFSLIICSVMLLNYYQLVTTDPLDSEVLEAMVERFQEDKSNEELKLEIRNLDLMARSAYFSNTWQIRSGAYLLIAGIVIMVAALRIYYSSKAEVVEPDSREASLDIELLVSRKWILYAASIVFGLSLIAAFLSIDHLSDSYVFTAESGGEEEIPVQQIISSENQAGQPVTVREGQVSEAMEEDSEMEGLSGAEITTEQPAEQVPEPAGESKAGDQPAAPAAPTRADIIRNFPAFRGPFGMGISYFNNIPTSWDGASGSNILWKTTIPLPGYSSPVIWDNRLFITGADENTQSVYCYDSRSGQLLWERKVTGIQRPAGKIDPTEDTGFAAPSATTDGRYVFAIFATGDIICTDLNGNEVWKKNIGIPDNHYGHSSSLLIWKDLVLIQFDTNESGRVLALNALNGQKAWETPRSSKISWASPVLANTGNRYELILASSPHVAGYDPESGRELWAHDCLSGEVGASAAYDNGVIFAANEYAKLVAFRPGSPPSVIWESNEYLPEVASPVASKDLLFVATSYGVIACFNAKSGEILWEYECDRGFYASPIINNDKVFFLDRGGKMYIFSLSATLNLINDPELGEMTVSTPAFGEGRIFIRGIDHLYCIGS